MPKLCSKMLKEPVELQSLTVAVDGYGGQDKTWTSEGTLWCMMKQTSGSESTEAGRLEAKTTVKFTTHYRSDIDATNRLIYNGVNYNIQSVENLDFGDVWMVIVAESGVPS